MVKKEIKTLKPWDSVAMAVGEEEEEGDAEEAVMVRGDGTEAGFLSLKEKLGNRGVVKLRNESERAGVIWLKEDEKGSDLTWVAVVAYNAMPASLIFALVRDCV